jgi:uncharacterized protein
MPLVILKATEKCNSNCSYCDVVRKDGTGRSMPIDVLETVFRRVNEYLIAFPGEEVELNWHGGEPLILGTDYFREAINDPHDRGVYTHFQADGDKLCGNQL